MKVTIPPAALFFLNVVLFITYIFVVRILASILFAFFVVIYLGSDVSLIGYDMVFVFDFAAIIIGIALTSIIFLTHKEHFFLFTSKR